MTPSAERLPLVKVRSDRHAWLPGARTAGMRDETSTFLIMVVLGPISPVWGFDFLMEVKGEGSRLGFFGYTCKVHSPKWDILYNGPDLLAFAFYMLLLLRPRRSDE